MKYRNRQQIVADVLDVILEAENGAKSWYVMRKANLSWPSLLKYTGLIISNRLAEYDPERKVYTTTDRGEEFRDKFKEKQRLCEKREKLDIQIENIDSELDLYLKK